MYVCNYVHVRFNDLQFYNYPRLVPLQSLDQVSAYACCASLPLWKLWGETIISFFVKQYYVGLRSRLLALYALFDTHDWIGRLCTPFRYKYTCGFGLLFMWLSLFQRQPTEFDDFTIQFRPKVWRLSCTHVHTIMEVARKGHGVFGFLRFSIDFGLIFMHFQTFVTINKFVGWVWTRKPPHKYSHVIM